MLTALYCPTFNDYGDPECLVALAQAAEAAGFDGFFIWDHIAIEPGGRLAITDSTVALGALAQATRRLRLGALVTPLARRRPWKFAKELVTLDCLSHGRIVCGVGLGEPAAMEFGAFGEDASPRGRALRLDEGLAILDPLLRGETVSHQGNFYQLDQVRLAPRAVQSPRMPIWVAAMEPAEGGFRRAARWDGCFPIKLAQRVAEGVVANADWSEWWLSPAEFRAAVQRVRSQRDPGSEAPFDFLASGRTLYAPAGQSDLLTAYAEAGATWWLEWVLETPGSFEQTLAAVRAGPPRRQSTAALPSREALRAAIHALHAEINKASMGDRAALAELQRLAAAVEQQVDSTTPGTGHGALATLREQVERLEFAHPRATRILNDLLMTLSNLGI
jgi:alkanesulfonate monooxygenase SsuD/methylene tetrahydromethanopterin reductase-like flavin-dependent oxidoreductase (luciferase family)